MAKLALFNDKVAQWPPVFIVLSLPAMTTGSILLAVAMFMIIALIVARPFLIKPPKAPFYSSQEALEAEKEALMARIRALDFDAQTGKQDEEAYEMERSLLLQEAAAVTAQLQEIGADSVEESIEAVIAAMRETFRQKDEDQTAEKADLFCPNCGRPTNKTDKFCANCGSALS